MAEENKNVTVTIDGIAVTVPAGTLLVEASKRIQREIPVYCYHEKLGPAGLCRICLVEIEKMPKLQIACNTVVTDGMVVHTASDRASEGRRAVLEFLLANHPLDCPICDKGGECDLQDYSIAYGQSASRSIDAKARKPKAIDLGPTIVLDDERCIVCQRCSRFDELITHEQSLVVRERGQRDVISTATGQPYVSNFSGNTTELCPVGALTSKTYRFKSRPWDLRRTETTCTQCSVGCAINVDVRHGTVLRTMSVPEDPVSDGWLCDRGRYNIGYLTDERRLTTPLYREDETWTQIDWDDAIALWAKALKAHPPRTHAVLGGGRLLDEEAFLLRHVFGAFGVEHFDWRAGRQRTAAHRLPVGSLADVERASAIVVLGSPPSQTAPVLDLWVRRAVAKHGARLFSVGPQPAASFVRETRLRDIAAIRDDVLKSERLVVISDGTVPDQADALVERLRAVRGDDAGVVGVIAGDQPNARGAQAAGLIPREGTLDAHGIYAAGAVGRLHTLAIFGANPHLRYPDRALVERTLQSVELTVVSELFLTETAKRARLVLPSRASFEKNGTTTNLAFQTRTVRAAVAAPAGTLSDGEILIALAAELGVASPTSDEIARRMRDAFSTTVTAVEPFASSHGDSKGEGLELIVIQHSFAGGGTSFHDASIAELRPRPSVTLSPKSAHAADVEAGDAVDLTAHGRTVRDLVVVVDPGVRDDVVLLVGGLPEAPATAIPPNVRVDVVNVRRGERRLTVGGAR